MSKRFLFVGENPSRTAHRKGWTWRDGRLAGCTLFEALRGCGINPDKCGFANAFGDNPDPDPWEADVRLRCLEAAACAGVKLVALGEKVSRVLTMNSIPHIKLRHPAARGAGRARNAYQAHVAETLRAA